MLLFEVAIFLPNLVKIGLKMREWHQFFEIQDGGSRHVGFRVIGRFSISNMCCYWVSQHFNQIWWKLVMKWENGISFPKFKMAVTAMLDSGYQAIIDIIDVLLFVVATFPPDSVLEIQNGCGRHFWWFHFLLNRHLENWILSPTDPIISVVFVGVLRCIRVVHYWVTGSN